MKALLLIAVAAGSAWSQTPNIDDIMSRVGRNQAKSLEARQEFLYHQKQLLRLMRGSGKLAREEHREYTVTPKLHGSGKDITHFDGKYESHGKFIAYGQPGYQYKEMDIDGELLHDLATSLMDDSGSRDGLSTDLFPLTYHQQLKYTFCFVDAEKYHGRRVYRVAFDPKKGLDSGESAWKGEALIDAEEYQPVQVSTKLAMRLPLVARTLLGTNIKGLGFSVSYQKFAEGVWFPVSYGGEFEVRAVFVYRRTIAVSMTNSDFRRTGVDSTITYTAQGQ